MSLVIGYLDPGERSVWMAGDGLVTFGCAQIEALKVRAFFGGQLLVGTTGLHRLNNLVLDQYAPSLSPQTEDAYAFALRFSEGLRHVAKEAGVVTTGKEGQEDLGARVLVGYDGRLFGIASDFSVIEHAAWWAIGCGCESAEGALAALDRLASPLRAPERLRFVLDLVASLDIHVGPPYTILRSPP